MEEQTTNENTEPTTAEDVEDSSIDRNSPAFKALIKQKQQADSQLAEMKARLDDIERAKADAEAEATRKRLEAEGKYDQILDELRAEQKRKEEQYEQELTRRDLESALRKEGMQDELALEGAIARFTGSRAEVYDYATNLKTKFDYHFKAPGMTPASAPAQGAQSAQGGSSDWAQVKADLHSGDRSKIIAANAKIKAFIEDPQNKGAMPPGF